MQVPVKSNTLPACPYAKDLGFANTALLACLMPRFYGKDAEVGGGGGGGCQKLADSQWEAVVSFALEFTRMGGRALQSGPLPWIPLAIDERIPRVPLAFVGTKPVAGVMGSSAIVLPELLLPQSRPVRFPW